MLPEASALEGHGVGFDCLIHPNVMVMLHSPSSSYSPSLVSQDIDSIGIGNDALSPATQESLQTSAVDLAIALASPAEPQAFLDSAAASQNQASKFSYQGYITGAIVFDGDGLPLEYFTTSQSSLKDWEQLVFQLLGLRWLLMSSLHLDDFSFAQASCAAYTAVLLRQRESYLALLAENLQDWAEHPSFRQWLGQFELAQLRRDRRFHSC